MASEVMGGLSLNVGGCVRECALVCVFVHAVERAHAAERVCPRVGVRVCTRG